MIRAIQEKLLNTAIAISRYFKWQSYPCRRIFLDTAHH